ncbi:asparagine synthase (glutamine-hydrolysing) [Clostridium cavendishii DSM 21758]|uniref:asparagine synthase (glutamine-hydrolyzing) n=1 Tax=Clostridium cavendishii DSM 21758 TaxID=1121302 RepID=A0A1M6QDA1_9CLOT|nr:asparagine synthase (glutamine-hydrolyzing) [Clostridium cavendishii]SHK18166.1 asparagine synthase (glutamine-hydrolysing) [Clostridium cavendishii DSM 21758]
MCGINGIFSKSIINDIGYRIEKMNNSIAHRGPDDGNYRLFDKRIALGHRRLSIIDTNSRANQPMISNSGRWIIVFNGEIYNYLELKKRVRYDFKTSSDTEVILAYVEKFGFEEFLKNANGMFAIALYDLKNDKIFLARDRMGVKPLFFFMDNDRIVFSSEIKGILNSGLVEAKFNEDAIDEYLGYRYVREPYTFFKEIYQLESGTFVSIDSELNFCKKRFWNLPDEFNMDCNYDEDKITEEFNNKIIDAIKRRLISDVPLGTYLSGGVDSSLITAITTETLKTQINTYTIGFPEMNEFGYAKLVSEKYNTIHHEIQINTDNYFNTMNEVISYKDAPLGVPNEIPLAVMSKILKEKITVVLSGEGADELMGGYGKIFRSPFDYQNLDNEDKSFYDYFINKYEYVPRNLRDKYLRTSTKLRNQFDEKLGEEFKNKLNEENVFRFFHKYHVKGLLHRVDITTMLAGVEARVPFLDYELIEYSYKNIPYELKLKWKDEKLKKESRKVSSNIYSEVNDIPKYLLKKIGYKYLPKEIIERKKVGFPVPLNEWMELLELEAKEILTDAYWLKFEKINELIEESKNNSRAGQIIWMFINIELFRKKYFLKEWIY